MLHKCLRLQSDRRVGVNRNNENMYKNKGKKNKELWDMRCRNNNTYKMNLVAKTIINPHITT
ncbi:23365_t:CDS:2 [Gigaspora margarita]|uniref:23365_t:CDS:1 n=1 Tax=Gigaspora margarita TaxID=4874 RepID=A0ABN7UW22_GIGMA|nr:23365_t:CDS:2 [Gigaspora margarita]